MRSLKFSPSTPSITWIKISCRDILEWNYYAKPTLSNLYGIRVKASGRPDTYSRHKLIRHSHAILFAEGYTFVRIGHVRVGADDFMPTSIILRRRRRRLRRVFLTPGVRVFPTSVRACTYDDTPYVSGRGVRRADALSRKTGNSLRTCYECVNRPATNDCSWASPIPWYPALSVLRPLKTRYGFGLVLRYRTVRINEAWAATQNGMMYRGLDQLTGNSVVASAREENRVIERGPPGTRRGPSAASDPFGASVRTRGAYLPRRGAQKEPEGPVSLCEKYIHASTNFCGGETRSCLRDRAGRSIARSIFKGPLAQYGLIWSRNMADTNREIRWRCWLNGRCYPL